MKEYNNGLLLFNIDEQSISYWNFKNHKIVGTRKITKYPGYKGIEIEPYGPSKSNLIFYYKIFGKNCPLSFYIVKGEWYVNYLTDNKGKHLLGMYFSIIIM